LIACSALPLRSCSFAEGGPLSTSIQHRSIMAQQSQSPSPRHRRKNSIGNSSSSSDSNCRSPILRGGGSSAAATEDNEECSITCGMSRRALLLLIGGFLCFVKLTADVYIYSFTLINDNHSNNNNSNKGQQQGGAPSSNLRIQQELFEAGMMLAQETHKTASYLRGLSSSGAASSSVSDAAVLNLNNNDNTEEHTNSSTFTTQDNFNQTNSPYAYAFVIGGVNPSKPAYKGFLYNILVSARVLRQLGSTADVVAFFQLSHAYRRSDTLPDEDLRALRGMGIKIYYIERSEHESFYETVMNKFRILQLTQYKRVLLMDGDVMPVSNLDYLFHLSDDNKFGPGNSTLRENVIVSGPWEPSNAGFFMLTPSQGDYDHILDIIQKRKQQADADDVLFDEVKGWGHVIEEGDEWVSRRETGRNWTFHFAFSDQGLLYHWTKYVKHSVSIVYHGRVENWSPVEVNGKIKAVKERVLDQPFLEHSKPLLRQYGTCQKFMCDFMHFSGIQKPWLRKPPTDLDDSNKLSNGPNIWWYFLMVVDHELGLKFDFANWTPGQRPSLGLYATWTDMGKHNKKTAALAEAAEKEAVKEFEEEQQELEEGATLQEQRR